MKGSFKNDPFIKVFFQILLTFQIFKIIMNELLKMSKQNKKLKKTLIFDINAGITCPNANECKSYVVMNANGKTSLIDGDDNIFRCYAASQENQYPNVYKARKYNHELILKSLMNDNGIKSNTIDLINK